MGNLLARLTGIFLLRLGPQDLPARIGLLVLMVTAYMVLSLIALAVGPSEANPFPPVIISVFLAMALSWIVLRLAGKSARWLQTVSALFGTAVLFRVLSFPLVPLAGPEAPAPLVILSLMLFFWSFAVDGHIYRHALDISLSTGVALAVTLFAVSYFILVNVTGPL